MAHAAGQFEGIGMIAFFGMPNLHKTEILKRQQVTAKPGFYASHLHEWDQAARAQLSSARTILADLLPPEEAHV